MFPTAGLLIWISLQRVRRSSAKNKALTLISLQSEFLDPSTKKSTHLSLWQNWTWLSEWKEDRETPLLFPFLLLHSVFLFASFFKKNWAQGAWFFFCPVCFHLECENASFNDGHGVGERQKDRKKANRKATKVSSDTQGGVKPSQDSSHTLTNGYAQIRHNEACRLGWSARKTEGSHRAACRAQTPAAIRNSAKTLNSSPHERKHRHLLHISAL